MRLKNLVSPATVSCCVNTTITSSMIDGGSRSTSATPRTGAAASAGSGCRFGARSLFASVMLFVATAASLAGQAITLVPTITTYAGSGATASNGDGGQATAAAINNPEGIAYDAFGNTYIADYGGNKIRVVSPAGVITTIFGTGTACAAGAANPACGDGGAASAATFNTPTQMQFDRSGNLFIADYGDSRVRKITATNGVITGASIISTIAGTGTAGDTGHGAAANAARINGPHGLVLDAAGNLYIAEQGGACVDRIAAPVTATSILTTFAGTCGTAGFGGDGGSATAAAARFTAPTGLAVDATGNVYIGDYQNGRVRKVTLGTTNTLSTIAGTGYNACPAAAPNAAAAATPACGDGGLATAATLGGPTGVYIDVAGNIVIGDAVGARVREIYGPNNPNAGKIFTVAGVSQECNNINQNINNASYPGCGDGGPAIKALVSFPILVSVNPQGNVQFVDQYDNKVRQVLSNIVFPPTNVGSASASQNVIVQVNTASTISSISVPKDAAGNPEFVIGTITGCTVNGTTSNAVGSNCVIPITFNPAYTGLQSQPLVIVTSNGTFTFALNGVGLGPQAILLPGTLSTIAGTGTATAGAPTSGVASAAATVNAPTRSSVDVSGNIYIADTKNNVVRIIYNSGASVSALIALENGGVTPVAGNIYTVAGTGTACATPTANPACGDGGLASAATLSAPTDVTLDTTDGNLVISDSGDNRIRLVNASTGIITTVVGTGAATGTADGAAPTATAIGTPVQTFVDINGSYYIVAKADNSIRYVPAGTGAVATVAGITGTACTAPTANPACGDGGQATAATLNAPQGISVDFNGDIYIADTGDNRVRYVTKSTGIITSLAGTGTAGFTGDGALATSAALNAPTSVFVDAATDVWIADSGNSAIREILTGGTADNIYTVAGIGVTPCAAIASSCGDGGPANVAALKTPTGIVLDTSGNLIITDSGANKVRKAATNPITLPFANTSINNTSTDSPKTAYLQNIGNTTLTLSQPANGSNPSISAPFTAGNAGTCPTLTTTTSTLIAGSRCSYSISFSPTAVGTYSGSLVETDNSLNATGSKQTINLTGTALEDNPTLTLTTNPNPSTYNQGVTLSSTVTGHGTTPTGTVSFYSVGATTAVNMQATAASTTTTQSLNLPAGTYSVAIIGANNGGLYNGWNSSSNTASNNLWTDRYGVQLCATCATNILAISGNPGYATDTAALAAYQATAQLNSGTTPVGNPYTFTLTSPQTVTFSVPDAGSFGDDSGGVSLGVTALTALGTGTVNGSGVATAVTANLPVGTTPVIAVYNGDTNNVSAESPIVNQVVNKDPLSNDTINATPNPTTFGTTVTLNFSVLVAAGDTPPTGTVTFTTPVAGVATTLGTASVPFAATTTTTVINGITYTTYTASTTTAVLAPGTDTVTGTYTGDSNYVGGALTTNVLVNTAAGASTLTASPSPSTYGTPVTLTESIAPINGACPTGPATFLNNGASIGTGAIALTGGQCVATLVTANLPVGTNVLTATVPASNGFAVTMTGPTNEVVNKAPVTNPTTPALSDTIAATPNPTTFGATDTLSFSILVAAGDAAPTGSVTFTTPIGGTATTLGTAAVPFAATTTTTVINGITYTVYTASTTTTALPQGTDTVTGTYTGDGNYAGGALTTNVVVNAAAATSALTASPSPSTYGTPVTITETINPINGVCPAGPATFLNNGASIGTGAIALTGGKCVATLVTANLPVGTDVLTATVPASNGFAATTSGPTNEVINKAPETNPTTPALSDTITASPNPQTFGSPVTLNFTVLAAAGNAAPTGTVTFSTPINGAATTLGTAAVSFTAGGTTVVNGVTYTVYTATTTSSALPQGSDTVTGTYTGDANYAGGPLTTTEQINAVSGAANLAVGPNPATYGTPVTITETITPVNGVCPAGPATFLNNGASIGTGVIALSGGQCVATLTTSKLPVGNDAITVTVPADANFNAITSGPVALVVNKANGADALTSSPNPSTFGQSVLITDTIPTVAGVAPTGTVNFYSYGTLIGTGTVNAQGVATLTTTTLPVGTDSLTGVYSGDANYAQVTSNAVNQVVNPVPTTPTLSAGPNPTTFGTLVTITETIPVVNGVAATGTVTFYQNGTQIGTGTINAQGVATITSTTLPVGTDPITAKYPGDTNYAAVNSGPVNVTINKANGADTLAASPNPAVFGSTVTITDTVPTVGGVAPTGTVTFYNNGTSIGTATITNGVATLTTTTLPVGSNPLTAIYGGDNNYAQVTSNQVNEVITVGSTNPVLGVNPNPATFGTNVTITESIPGINGIAPTGTVQFFSNGTLIGTGTVTNGVATLQTTTLPIGTDQITAKYSGDANYAAANSGPVNEVINKAAPTDTVTATPSPSTFGSSVALTFTVPLVNGVVPTGTVTFLNGTTVLGTAAVNAQGIATLNTTTLPVGTNTINTQYPGDNTYAAANPSTTAVVNAVSGAANLAVGPNPATYGTPVTITETITPVNGVCPAGPATFLNNGASIGTGVIALSGGQCVATLTTSKLPVGNDAITVTVPADANFNAITSGPVALVVNKANGADALTSSPNPSTFGQSVLITDTIPTVAGVAPTGTVNFYSYGTLIGTGTVNAQGVATLTTTTLPVGTDSLTGVYSGDANYAQVTSNAVNQVVNPVPTTPTLSAGPNPTTFGTLVTITETIPVVNGVAATGTVTFYQNGTQIGTGTINAQGVATITSTTLPVGTDPITAKYPGDTNYAAVNSGPVNVTINKANGADTLAASPNPAVFGSTVTITDTVPTVGGVAPTGTVTFYNNGTSIGTAPIVNGVATLTTTTLPVGSNPLTAIYGGDTNYAQVTSNQVNEVITVGSTNPVLGVNPNPATFGTNVTITESIPGINGIAPTGTVQFFSNGTLIGTGTVTNGVATLQTTTLPIGTDQITAKYSGDANYAAANSGPVNEVINKAAPTDTVTATPSPSTFGSSVALTFTVPLVNGVVPTGTVTFLNGTTVLGTAAVNAQGIATLNTTTLPVGTNTINTQYPGDNTYAAANPSTTAVVNAAAGTGVLTVNPNPSAFGTPVTLTETIAPINGACPAGPTTFLNNGVSIGTGVITLTGGKCVATLVTSTLPVGTDTITATVPASNGFTATNSGPVSLVVGKTAFGNGDTLTSSNLTPRQGQSVTFTFTIPTVNGVAPTGTVQFFNGTTLIGTGTVTNGVATLTTSTLPTGTSTINATYSGDGTYAGGTLSVTEQVTPNDFSIAATPANQIINPGDTAVYTVSLTGIGGPFTSPVTLTATGLPKDATVTFGTPTYVPGVGPTPTSMTIVTSPLHAQAEPVGFGPKVFYGLLLLPLLGVRRLRRKLRALPKGIVYGLAALLMLGGMGAITGCAGGYFGGAGAQYTITVTGTSGTLVHSTTVTLTVR